MQDIVKFFGQEAADAMTKRLENELLADKIMKTPSEGMTTAALRERAQRAEPVPHNAPHPSGKNRQQRRAKLPVSG